MSTKSHQITFGERTYLMGIVNVTPDSFSGDGLMNSNKWVDSALKLANRSIFNGADIITKESDFNMCIALSPPAGAENESGEEMEENEMGYVVVASDGKAKNPTNLFLNHDGTKGTY